MIIGVSKLSLTYYASNQQQSQNKLHFVFRMMLSHKNLLVPKSSLYNRKRVLQIYVLQMIKFSGLLYKTHNGGDLWTCSLVWKKIRNRSRNPFLLVLFCLVLKKKWMYFCSAQRTLFCVKKFWCMAFGVSLFFNRIPPPPTRLSTEYFTENKI